MSLGHEAGRRGRGRPRQGGRRTAWPRCLVVASLSPRRLAPPTSLGHEAGWRGRGRQRRGVGALPSLVASWWSPSQREGWRLPCRSASRPGGRGTGASGRRTARCLALLPHGGFPLAFEDCGPHVAQPQGWAAEARTPAVGGRRAAWPCGLVATPLLSLRMALATLLGLEVGRWRRGHQHRGDGGGHAARPRGGVPLGMEDGACHVTWP